MTMPDEPKFDAITGEPIEGLPDRTAATTDEQVFSDTWRELEPWNFHDPQQELEQRVRQLETSRAGWIAVLLLALAVMAGMMWEQKSEYALLLQDNRLFHEELCSKVEHHPDYSDSCSSDDPD